MECASYQEQNPVALDYGLATRSLETLLGQQDEKVEQLKEVMPQVPKFVVKNKPKAPYKKDGTLSVYGENWFRTLRENKFKSTEPGPIKVISHYEEPNPNSHVQVKDWLFSLGWKPCTFKYERDKDTGDERKILQVRKDGELVPSVTSLMEKEPSIEILEGLTVIQHRISVFKGFIESCWFETPDGKIKPYRENDEDGYYWLKAEIGGLTNTLRFAHKKPLVNLPGVDKPWGKEIRSCLMAPKGKLVIGADLNSLESTTKRHFIYPHDPDYAEEMAQEGFDEHLDLAVKSGAITQEEYDFYQTGDEDDPKWKQIHKVRKLYKPVNYSAIYGVGVPKLSREMNITKAKAGDLLESYWERNWSVKVVAKEQYVKEVNGTMWLKNPVSGFYHELRYDKDRFSTLNQSTGVYIFDSWLARARAMGYMGNMQFHDETAAIVAYESHNREILQRAIEKLNKDLTLNVSFGVDVKVGSNYAEVH